MEMIVIYDETGHVYYCAGGSVTEPVGLPFLRVVIPDKKVLIRIDLSGEEPVPVYDDLPASETDKLRITVEALTGELLDTQEALAALFESRGV